MKAKSNAAAGLAAAVMLLVAGRAGAALFDTFGPGDSYDPSSGYTIDIYYDHGNQFAFVGPQYRLDSIDVAISHVYDLQGQPIGPDAVDVWLMSDDNNKPGSLIEAFHFEGQMGVSGQSSPLLVGTSVLRPVLNPGPYWLVVSAPEDATWAEWNFSNQAVTSLLAWRVGTGPWQIGSDYQMAAFRVNGTVVPVPGAVVLGWLGISFAGWMCRRRER